MLKYPCLVLDHDDTVVASEITVNYPCFLLALEKFRPGETMGYEEFVQWCFRYDFSDFLRIKYNFTEAEQKEEYQMWLDYARTRIPPAYPGLREIILEQKRQGGLVCVASLSSRYNILRDYREHFGIEPDLIFSRDEPREQCKPNPYPLETIMGTFGLSQKDLLMVDDLKIGLDMARAAGVDFAYAGWGRRSMPQIGAQMAMRSDYAFDSTEEFHQFLFGKTV